VYVPRAVDDVESVSPIDVSVRRWRSKEAFFQPHMLFEWLKQVFVRKTSDLIRGF